MLLRNLIFQRDNSLVHKSKIFGNFFFRKKSGRYWIVQQTDADVVRKLNENNKNRLLDVQRANGVLTRY